MTGLFHLVVIDDMTSDALPLQELLETDFPDVHTTALTNATDAILYCQRAPQRPNIILLDLHVGPDSGLDLLRELKANPVTRPIPVIIFSGSARNEDVAAAYAAHASGYLVKPGTLAGLSAMLQTLLAHWRQIRTAY